MNMIAFWGSYFSVISGLYFINRILHPKHSKKADILTALLLFFFVSYGGTYLFYGNTLIKPLVGAAAIFFTCGYLYQGKRSTQLTIGIICCTYTILVDIIMMAICMILFGRSVDISNPVQQLFMVINCNLLLFLLYDLTARLIHQKLIFSKVFIQPFIIMMVYFLMAVYVIGYMYDGSLESCKFGHTQTYHEIKNITLYTMLVMIIPLLYLIFRKLIKMEKDLSRQLLMKKMHQEYDKRLAALVTDQPSEKYLRHELIHYIETFLRIKNTQNRSKRESD